MAAGDIAADFRADPALCIRCGACVEDCLVGAIDMMDTGPALAREEDCLKCQHCLAICPAGAVSIFGKRPADSLPVADLPDPEALRRLMLGRRSIRLFREESLPPELLRELVDVAWNAPTGVNMQDLHFTVVADRKTMTSFRATVYARMGAALDDPARAAGPRDETLRELLDDWQTSGRDDIFRNAPHMVLASTAPGAMCASVDPYIALSYLELYARTKGVGTLWCGFAMLALSAFSSRDLLREMGVPRGYRPAYTMMLGWPKYEFPRGVQRGPAPASFYGLNEQ